MPEFGLGLLLVIVAACAIIYPIVCAIRFLYAFFTPKGRTSFTNRPAVLILFGIPFILLALFNINQYQTAQKIDPATASSAEIVAYNRTPVDWATGALVAPALLGTFVGLPIDLIRNRIRRNKQTASTLEAMRLSTTTQPPSVHQE